MPKIYPDVSKRNYYHAAELADLLGFNRNTITGWAIRYKGFGKNIAGFYRFPKDYVERLESGESPQEIAENPNPAQNKNSDQPRLNLIN